MKRPYLIPLAVLCCAGIAYAAGTISVTGYPAVPRTLKGGVGINIGYDGTFTATGEAVTIGSQPFTNLSSALNGRYLDKTGTAAAANSANAYKGNAAPSATEFSYLQGVTSAIQTQLDSKAPSTIQTQINDKVDISSAGSVYLAPNGSQAATTGIGSDVQTALNGKQASLGYTAENTANKGIANGYPSLDATGKIPSAQVPTLNQNTTGTAAGLTAQYIDWSLTTGGASIKNRPTLSKVATSNLYGDLDGKPSAYTLPTASPTVLGGVKIDGSSIQIDGAGVIRSTVAAGVSEVNHQTGVVDLRTVDITGFDNYSAGVNSRLAAKMDNVNPTYSGTLGTTNTDGTHALNVRNSVAFSGTPSEGDFYTDATGKMWLYLSGAWVEKAAPYTLPTASPSTLGGVKTGNTLTIANGVLDVMVSSLGPSGLVTAGLEGNQTISSGFAYVATATPWKATFNSFTSAKQSTVFAVYSGTICAASGSKVVWANPVTFANTSSQCAKLRTGTRATVQMQGGRTLATVTQNLQKANVPSASVSPTSLAFGSVGTGSTSTLTATLTNSGLANLVTGSPSITGTDAGKFAITANGCNAATVIPGATCVESVTFTPGATAGGPYSAQLSIPSNSPNTPTLVALSGTGYVADPYTALYQYNFDVSDGADVTATASPGTWTTKTGTSGSVSGNKWVVALASSNASNYLTKSGLTAKTDVSARVDMTFPTVTGLPTSQLIDPVAVKNTTAVGATLELYATSGTLSGVKVKWQRGDNTAQVSSNYAYSFAANTNYTFDLRYKCSSTTSNTDGYYSVYINGVEVVPQTAVSTYAANITMYQMGATYINNAMTYNLPFDKAYLGWK